MSLLNILLQSSLASPGIDKRVWFIAGMVVFMLVMFAAYAIVMLKRKRTMQLDDEEDDFSEPADEELDRH